jgi:hypothetical protein
MKSDNLIYKIVNRYIGVSGGYLGLPAENRFTYGSHREFYPEYCDLTKDTSGEGTTRDNFIRIFTESAPKEQAKIIRGVIERFPVGPEPATRTEDLKQQLLAEAKKLDTVDYINQPSLEVQSGTVFEALEDAKSLIENRKAVSAVDRVHTAFHGYLRFLCKASKISFEQKDDIVSLVKKIFNEHPKLKIKIKAQEIQNIAKSLASISDSLNPIRNQGSLAHPNETLLDEPEATLVINSVRSLMIYLEAKLK